MKYLTPNSPFNQRLTKLRQKLIENQLAAIIISSQANRFYLTGWPGDSESGYLLVTLKKAFIITDSRYTEEATAIKNFELLEFGLEQKFWEQLLAELRIKKIGFEAKDLSIFQLKKLKKQAKNTQWVPTQDLVEELRSQKDQDEILTLKKSIGIAESAFDYVLKNIQPGQTEKEIAWKMEQYMREKGASKLAWEPLIVASGPNSSKVHYSSGDRKIKPGDQILFDWGCVFQGYSCDISRVLFLGTPTERQVQVYNLVLEAQELAIEKVKSGVLTKEVDLTARQFLAENSKFGFGHALGHGVGIDVHELPHISSKTKDQFKVGNVITIEPGIYEPGRGGVRIEDMVIVTENSYEVLTKAPKELNKIIV